MQLIKYVCESTVTTKCVHKFTDNMSNVKWEILNDLHFVNSSSINWIKSSEKTSANATKNVRNKRRKQAKTSYSFVT